MKGTLPTPLKSPRPLPPAPQPGGPAISVPIEQCEAWRKYHGLKIVGADHSTWPPRIVVVVEKA